MNNDNGYYKGLFTAFFVIAIFTGIGAAVIGLILGVLIFAGFAKATSDKIQAEKEESNNRQHEIKNQTEIIEFLSSKAAELESADSRK